MHLFSGSGEIEYSIPLGNGCELQPLAAIAVVYVTSQTNAIQPLTVQQPQPHAWLMMPSLGLGLNVALSTSWFWTTNLRVAALLPHATLTVEDQQFTLGLPMLLASSGVGVRF